MTAPVSPVGLIGLGLVGQAIAQRLREAGIATLGYDIRAEARAAFDGEAADSVRLLGERCDTVVLAVFDTGGVVDSVEGAQGLLSATAPRTQLLIACSTGDPDQLQALSARLAARGLGFVEAPLSGSSEQITAGQATMLVGTDAATLQQLDDALGAFGNETFTSS